MVYRIEVYEISTMIKDVSEYEKLHDKEKFDSKEDPQYGYMATAKEVTEEKKIYEQTTDKTIKLKSVIDAFNITSVIDTFPK